MDDKVPAWSIANSITCGRLPPGGIEPASTTPRRLDHAPCGARDWGIGNSTGTPPVLRFLRRLGPAFALLLATAVAAMAFLIAYDIRALATWIDSANWTPTAATVVEITFNGRNNTWTAYYRYTGGGRPQTGSYLRRHAKPRVGDPLDIIVDPRSPDRSARSRGDLFGRTEVLGWLMLPILAAAAWGLSTVRWRRTRDLADVRAADRDA